MLIGIATKDAQDQLLMDIGDLKFKSDGQLQNSPLLQPRREEIYDEDKVRCAMKPLIDVENL